MALALFNGLRNSLKYTSHSLLCRNIHSARVNSLTKTVSKEIERNPAAFGGSSLLSQCWAYFSGLNSMSVRTHIRIHFPKPCEQSSEEKTRVENWVFECKTRAVANVFVVVKVINLVMFRQCRVVHSAMT
ncbi:hypothetical protein J437_LFUL005096 [Ladona fulva]|uniref:Uncharacterized protein n=1 Tax=Ladona fulva TaxID=123851 RepID=A0A8K0JX31_LADFU|nr:hypothetical protein J437_LFUL005096 [Ladona fulva]